MRWVVIKAERYFPACAALACFFLIVYYSQEILILENRDLVNWKNLYTAVFDWSAVQTGFLFGVYGFVFGKTDGFIGAVRNTIAMKNFIGYTRNATIVGFFLTIISIPMLVVNPTMNSQYSAFFFIIAAWFSVFVWAFISFLRVAFIFGIIVRTPENDRLKG